MKDGFIAARNQVDDFHDVANQGALSAYKGSHDYARLYFRPKNGFHFRTEGIKCRQDAYRQENQMSVPVCFVFRLADVLTREDALFSAGIMFKEALTPFEAVMETSISWILTQSITIAGSILMTVIIPTAADADPSRASWPGLTRPSTSLI